MPLIDLTYFQGETNIPQLSQAFVAAEVNRYLAKYERQILEMLLGVSMYNAFIDGLAVTPTVDPKWTRLKNGATYEDGDGEQRRWMGFTNTEKESIIAAYTYFNYMSRRISFAGGSGEVAPGHENGERVSPAVPLAMVWNDMSEWIESLFEFLKNHPDDYPDWKDYGTRRVYFAKINTFNI